jgi:hypothetical protein
MPWTEISVMDERLCFIAVYLLLCSVISIVAAALMKDGRHVGQPGEAGAASLPDDGGVPVSLDKRWAPAALAIRVCRHI